MRAFSRPPLFNSKTHFSSMEALWKQATNFRGVPITLLGHFATLEVPEQVN
jgi:hypothetical protein